MDHLKAPMASALWVCHNSVNVSGDGNGDVSSQSSVHNNVNGMLLLQLSTWCELSLRLREILDGDW
jgi:hypothetical protein